MSTQMGDDRDTGWAKATASVSAGGPFVLSEVRSCCRRSVRAAGGPFALPEVRSRCGGSGTAAGVGY
jgi:hypothetical protein